MRLSAAIATVAMLGTCAVCAAPAMADGYWHSHRYSTAPRYYRPYGGNLRYYNSPRAYRSACSYGDCACLRAMALRTGNQNWWDKYQACSGN